MECNLRRYALISTAKRIATNTLNGLKLEEIVKNWSRVLCKLYYTCYDGLVRNAFVDKYKISRRETFSHERIKHILYNSINSRPALLF